MLSWNRRAAESAGEPGSCRHANEPVVGRIEEFGSPGGVFCRSDLMPSRSIMISAGARLLFLPPCGPDLNSIEQVFAMSEHLLRNAAGRTAEATWRRIGDLLDRFLPEERGNYFRNSGHASIKHQQALHGPDVRLSGSALMSEGLIARADSQTASQEVSWMMQLGRFSRCT